MEQTSTHQHPPQQDEGKLITQPDYPLPPTEKSDKHFQPPGPGNAPTKLSTNSASNTNYPHVDMSNNFPTMDSTAMPAQMDQYNSTPGSQSAMPPGSAMAPYDNGMHRPAMFMDMKTSVSSSNPPMLGPPSYNQGGGPGAMTMSQQSGSTPTLNQLLTQNPHSQKYPPSSYPTDYPNSNMPGGGPQPMYDGWPGRGPQNMYPGNHMRPTASPRVAAPNQVRTSAHHFQFSAANAGRELWNIHGSEGRMLSLFDK